MWRRLYLSFPDREHTRIVADELEHGGIPRSQLHAVDGNGGHLPDLPEASDAQRHDRVWLWDRLYWNANLALFGVALLGFLAALYSGAFGWMVLCAAIMAMTFFSGKYFAENIPHAHLADMKETLRHGEIVLMVDLPPGQVHAVEREVSRHHPEAGGHLVGWSMPRLGM